MFQQNDWSIVHLCLSDLNECEKDNGGCDHDCHSYDGGHYCTCKAGYILLEDGEGCEGKNKLHFYTK